MTEVFLGQIMLTGFGFAPKGFALCNGQRVSIQQNQALYALLGVMYGGDGVTNFALPNLQSRTPVGAGASADPSWMPSPYSQGAAGGSESVALSALQGPAHQYQVNAVSAAGTARDPTNALYGTNTSAMYGPADGLLVPLNGLDAPGGVPHPNLQPFVTINFVIALSGIWPSRP